MSDQIVELEVNMQFQATRIGVTASNSPHIAAVTVEASKRLNSSELKNSRTQAN